MARNKNYIDKKEMFDILVEYRSKCKGTDKSKYPTIPNALGKMFIDLAEGIASRPNFSGYMYKDDMVADGIENCLRAVHNFNPEKSDNPFGYFSRIIWFAFLRKIQKEKEEMYRKFKVAEKYTIAGEDTEGDGGGGFLDIDGEYITNFVKEFEEKRESKRRTSVEANTGVEDFFSD